jgi:hypothetical protein
MKLILYTCKLVIVFSPPMNSSVACSVPLRTADVETKEILLREGPFEITQTLRRDDTLLSLLSLEGAPEEITAWRLSKPLGNLAERHSLDRVQALADDRVRGHVMGDHSPRPDGGLSADWLRSNWLPSVLLPANAVSFRPIPPPD